MKRLESIVIVSIITILAVWNYVMIYKLATFEDKLKQKEYQIKIREIRERVIVLREIEESRSSTC